MPLKHASRALCLLLVAVACGACRSYGESTPRQYLTGDDPANYRRIFRHPVPSDVTPVNSLVVSYAFRPGVVTTNDFEFELIAPDVWTRDLVRRWGLVRGASFERDAEARKSDASAWYAPKPIGDYEVYGNPRTSISYVHLLVEKSPEPDGRRRVFVSKH